MQTKIDKNINNQKIQKTFNYLTDNLNRGINDWILLYGKPGETAYLLKDLLFPYFSNIDRYFCVYIDASNIETPLDFFVPILKEKYGDKYYDEEVRDLVKIYAEGNENYIFKLSELCGQEKRIDIHNAAKMPIILIEGIEEVMFKLDYPEISSDENKKRECYTQMLNEEIKKMKDMENKKELFESEFSDVIDYAVLPNKKMFGNCIRADLQQFIKAIVFGTVRNPANIEYLATLQRPGYSLYKHNFHRVDLEQLSVSSA